MWTVEMKGREYKTEEKRRRKGPQTGNKSGSSNI